MSRRTRRALRAVLALAAIGCACVGSRPDPELRHEAGIEAFLGRATLNTRPLFDAGRFPNVVVTTAGTVLATWGQSSVRARRSADGGASWGEVITIADPGFHGGGTTVDEDSGDVLVFVEAGHPPAPITVYRSRDDGRSWQRDEVTIHPDSNGNLPSMHMNEHGIALRRGANRGRLLRPSRWYAGQNDPKRWSEHYTSAIYSDDGGATWSTSAPFAAFGTGEATLAELSDGRIYYNSRRHWAPAGSDPRRRWTAWSDDGGATWSEPRICAALPDGPQDSDYGCMAGLVRLPIVGRDVLLYSNCDSPNGRRRGTVWASFDGGRSWPLKRLVREGGFAYSSLAAGRPGTPSAGWIYLHFEDRGSKVARFDLSWVLAGEPTGDGAIPAELAR